MKSAEEKGFEPLVELPPRRFSKRAARLVVADSWRSFGAVAQRKIWPLLALALSLAGCGVHWTERDAWWGLVAFALFELGTWGGARLADSKWRSKGECPPNGGGRMLSGGRFYWVCAEDADPSARQFVAHMLQSQTAANAEARR